MGCWNGTCAFSNLSIRVHDRVKLILLASVPVGSGREMGGGFCYSRLNWNPLFVPLSGRYNDYGSVEEIDEGPHTKYLLDFLSDEKNHKIVADKDQSPFKSVEDVVACIERGFLQIKQGVFKSVDKFALDENGQPVTEHCGWSFPREWVNVGFMLVHEKIFDGMLASVPDPITEEELNDLRDRSTRRADRLGKELADSFFNEMLQERLTGGCQFRVDPLGFEVPLKDQFVLYKMERAMESMRKFYSIQSGAGSQEENSETVERLMGLTSEVIDNRKKEEEAW